MLWYFLLTWRTRMKVKNEIEYRFNELWHENEAYIRKLCSYKLNSMPQHIDDCVQEIFGALYETMVKGTVIEHPRAWLSRVANNKIKDLYSIQKKESSRIISLLHEDLAFHTVDFNEEDSTSLSDEAILSAKQFVVEQLSECERQLLNERFVQRKNIAEMALIHNTTEENIRQKVFRLRKRVKFLIRDYYT